MSLHKLSAGDGYTSLTRQVAVQDSTERGLSGLGAYYSEKGEARPACGWAGGRRAWQSSSRRCRSGSGRWWRCSGRAGTRTPTGSRRRRSRPAGACGPRSPPPAWDGRSRRRERRRAFRVQLAVRFAQAISAAGRPRGAALPDDERARIRTKLAAELFVGEYGRAPADAREVSGFLARAGRPAARAVAGYDLTFTPVKSVSALWAVADPATAEGIERAHTQVVSETLGWLEDHASFTRLGAGGVRQIEVRGLIAAAFLHRDSRAGDPNLHTHVAVSNKVQVASGPDAGRWLALDGRPLHQLAVAASERYTTRLEAVLRDRLGVTFTDRPGGVAGKRPVRELVGVDPRLLSFWSSRRTAIDVRRAELASRFQADHGRPPTPVEALKLAQRATLETRQAKHEPRSRTEQRQVWREQAHHLLGPERLEAMLDRVQQPPRGPSAPEVEVTGEWAGEAARRVVAAVQGGRATWREAHVRAEAERVVRAARLPHPSLDDAVDRVVAAALAAPLSLPLSPHLPPEIGEATPEEPAVLRRSDGSSVYRTVGSDLFTSATVLAAEDALLDLAGRGDGRVTPGAVVELALLEAAANGRPLNRAQAHLVRKMATSGARVQLALAPAGTGKTTALRVLARAWTDSGGTVLGLAPSAAAAAVLRAELDGAPTDTLAKLLWSINQLTARDPAAATVPGWVRDIGPATLLLLDEAGMAGTVELARAAQYVTSRGGSVRLVGDDAQLRAVAAGGVLRDLAAEHGAVTLDAAVRFTDPAEGPASLALRAGDPVGLGFYLDRQRVHVGDPTTAADQAYAAWQSDRLFGLDSLLLAPTREQVLALNLQARADRLARTAEAGRSVGRERQLADGSHVSAGDVVLTRRNDRRLATSATDWVKNGDRWNVTTVQPDGGLAVTHVTTGRHTVLPPEYVGEHLTLGYASTVHTAQGSTADTAHVVVTGTETREVLYVGLTRGRTANHVYAVVVGDGDPHRQTEPDVLAPPTAVELLTRVLSRDGAQTSATTTVRQLVVPALQLADAAARYTDAVQVVAQQHLRPDRLLSLEVTAERVLPGLTDAPAWPALRDRLTLFAAAGTDPAVALKQAVAQGALQDARDLAAVLDWRLTPPSPPPPTRAGVTSTGLLPWLAAPPKQLADDPTWGPYLLALHAHAADLAVQVAGEASQRGSCDAPSWASPLHAAQAPPDLIGRVAVWRAAQRVDTTDLRITGPPADTANTRLAQQSLDHDLARALPARPCTEQPGPVSGAQAWTRLMLTVEPRLLTDPTWPYLAHRLDRLEQTGADAQALLRAALDRRPLPDELPAAALLCRLPIAPAHDLGDLDRATQQTSPPLAPPKPVDLWRELARLVDPRLVAGTDWPALAGALDRAHRSGYDIERHLPRLAAQEPLPDERPARTLQYRLVDDCPASIRTIPARTQQQIDRERIEQARQRMATPEPGHGSSHSPAERPSAGGVRR